MKKIYLTISLIFTLLIAKAQHFDVRKLTLKSDVILFCDQASVSDTAKIINDYTSEYFYKIKFVDTIIKNKIGFDYKKSEIKLLQDNEDYFIQNMCAPTIGYPMEMNKRYYQMLFLKKIGKQYYAIGSIKNNYTYEEWNKLIAAIKSVAMIENLSDLKERYTKTIDWFMAHNVKPTADFLIYYKQIGLLKTDTALLNEQQLLKAKENFLAGNENLLSLVAKQYHNEIKDYYLDKLKSIHGIADEYSYSNCADFKEAIRLLTNNFNDDYEDVNYVLCDLLTSEISYYDKGNIMTALIKVVEKGDYKVGEFSTSK